MTESYLSLSAADRAAAELPSLEFPRALPRVLSLSRTFWEKATAAHVFCRKGSFRGERPSRHWYDLAAISRRDDFETVILSGEAARLVAENKTAFFRENDAAGSPIDYFEAITGKLQLTPEGHARALLESDYDAMIEGGMLPESALSFPQLLEHCRKAEEKANRILSGAVT